MGKDSTELTAEEQSIYIHNRLHHSLKSIMSEMPTETGTYEPESIAYALCWELAHLAYVSVNKKYWHERFKHILTSAIMNYEDSAMEGSQ